MQQVNTFVTWLVAFYVADGSGCRAFFVQACRVKFIDLGEEVVPCPGGLTFEAVDFVENSGHAKPGRVLCR